MSPVKSKLLEEINKIEDESILQQLVDLIAIVDQEIGVEFNNDQIEQIKASQNQIKNGEYFEHDEVMKMIKE